MQELHSIEDWEACIKASHQEPVFLFKHSTRCPISAKADSIVHDYDSGPAAGRPRVFRVKVVEFRPVSDEVARSLNVEHKSPQLVLVKNGAAVWSTSHYDITPDSIQEAAAGFCSKTSVGPSE